VLNTHSIITDVAGTRLAHCQRDPDRQSDAPVIHAYRIQTGAATMITTFQPEVFVVDDDVSVRIALTRLLSSAGHTVRAFSSAREFLDSQCYLQPGCLILDVRLPGLDGLELHERLHSAGTSIPVVFLTGFGDIPTTVRAMKSGAVDFLPKPVSDDTLLRAVETALREEARQRADRMERLELGRRFQLLTPREGEVFRLVLAGRLNKQIARELGISEKTVKVHRGRVMSKMGARRVAQLVQFATRLGYVGASRQETPLNFEPAPVWPQSVVRIAGQTPALPLSA
jgi:FixJ family two-component response regulator